MPPPVMRQPGRGRRVLAIATAAAVVIAAVAGLLMWRAASIDTDGDGITDRTELSGWQIADGTVYRTDPEAADTDGDGLTDLDEAGPRAASEATADAYVGFSDPLLADTDDDALTDAAEADAGLDPRDPDVDDDGLRDGYELDVTGTDPESADTDGDSLTDAYEDANRETQGLDPLSPDEQISTLDFLVDFSKGLVAGELLHEDSLGWLAGSLVAGAASAAPGAGAVVGGVTGARDAVAAAIKGDFVGAGFNALNIVPVKNLAKMVPTIRQFLERNPHLAVAAAGLVSRSDKIPDWVKVRVAKLIWSDWDELVAAGADEGALLALQNGRTDLTQLAATMRRAGSIAGAPASPLARGRVGEAALAKALGAHSPGVDTQVRLSTAGCTNGCTSGVRIVDVLKDGIAHESKVGYVAFTAFTKEQILKDAWLIKQGAVRGARWHFFSSDYSNTLGADPRVFDLLDQAGIRYTTYPPAAA